MSSITKADLTRINRLMEAQTILWAEVDAILGEKDAPIVTLAQTPFKTLEKYTHVIRLADFDAFVSSDTRASMVGFQVPYTVIEVDAKNSVIYCSRKEAQLKLKEHMTESLENHTNMTGRIIRITNYGAFVDVGGLVGLLYTKDFSSDFSQVSDYKKTGDSLLVHCKEIDSLGRILWESAEPFHRTKPFVTTLKQDMITTGNVIAVNSFENGTGAFVRCKGVDILCSLEPLMEVSRGQKVVVRISKIVPSADVTQPPRVRGHIIDVR